MIQSTDMEKYGPIYAALVDAYGEPTWRPSLPPVDELISTILSQNTNDTNRDTAFERLRDRFGSWEAVRDADASKVVEAIRPAGLANQKAPRIQQALREITDQAGKISLDFLQDMSVDEAKSWLTGLHGVGPKTAAIVLLFGMGRPAFPVDTHVHRVTQRLGLIPAGMSAEKAHDRLEEIVPPDQYFAFHLNLIKHGREICVARNPHCERCFLQEWCDYYQNVKAG
jgi:endonuclease-3